VKDNCDNNSFGVLNNSSVVNIVVCYHCQKKGHYAYQCPKKNKNKLKRIYTDIKTDQIMEYIRKGYVPTNFLQQNLPEDIDKLFILRRILRGRANIKIIENKIDEIYGKTVTKITINNGKELSKNRRKKNNKNNRRNKNNKNLTEDKKMIHGGEKRFKIIVNDDKELRKNGLNKNNKNSGQLVPTVENKEVNGEEKNKRYKKGNRKEYSKKNNNNILNNDQDECGSGLSLEQENQILSNLQSMNQLELSKVQMNMDSEYIRLLQQQSYLINKTINQNLTYQQGSEISAIKQKFEKQIDPKKQYLLDKFNCKRKKEYEDPVYYDLNGLTLLYIHLAACELL